jgi:hypothetical protein
MRGLIEEASKLCIIEAALVGDEMRISVRIRVSRSSEYQNESYISEMKRVISLMKY